MSLRIQRPGLLTTVQDRGRHGLQHIGVVPCGAMDPVALELANGIWVSKCGSLELIRHNAPDVFGDWYSDYGKPVAVFIRPA